MPKGLRLGRGRKVCQNDQYIKLINFCFGSELVKVIPTEEAYSMLMGSRLGITPQNDSWNVLYHYYGLVDDPPKTRPLSIVVSNL